MTAEQQTDMLARYIMAEVPGEPSRNEGAGACAIRIIQTLQKREQRMKILLPSILLASVLLGLLIGLSL